MVFFGVLACVIDSVNYANTLKETLVYDVLGKQVARFENKSADNQTQFDLTQLNKGIYLVRLLLEDGSQSTKKVVIN